MLDESQPVVTFGSVGALSPFQLAREVTERPKFGDRPAFFIPFADPVTTRCLQLWRPHLRESKTKWLREFEKLRPGDLLLCWLACMGAVSVVDVLLAILGYGWSGDLALPLSAYQLRGMCEWLAGRPEVKASDVRDRILEALSDIERSPAKQNNNGTPFEWLEASDARALLDACVARESAKSEDQQ